MRNADVMYAHDRVGSVRQDGDIFDESGSRIGHVDAAGRVYRDHVQIDAEGNETWPESAAILVGRVFDSGEIEDRHQEQVGRVDAEGDVYPGERGGSRIGSVGTSVPRIDQAAAAMLLLLAPAAAGRR